MAVEMFIKIDGIDGGSTNQKHKEEIEVLSYSWGLSQSLSPGGGGGGGAGKVNVNDFSIVKQIDVASPQLMEACCEGRHIRDVTMTLVNKGGGGQQEFLKIKLTDCLITSYQTGAGGGSAPVDSVSFNFTNVDIQAADKNGKFVSQVSCNFAKGGDGLAHNH